MERSEGGGGGGGGDGRKGEGKGGRNGGEMIPTSASHFPAKLLLCCARYWLCSQEKVFCNYKHSICCDFWEF